MYIDEERYDVNNLFLKIISNELDCVKIYEDSNIIAFHDISPVRPVHMLCIPKGKFVSFNDFMNKASENTIGKFFKSISKACDKIGIKKYGYRIISNSGYNSGQTIFHFHIHVIGKGQKIDKLI